MIKGKQGYPLFRKFPDYYWRIILVRVPDPHTNYTQDTHVTCAHTHTHTVHTLLSTKPLPSYFKYRSEVKNQSTKYGAHKYCLSSEKGFHFNLKIVMVLTTLRLCDNKMYIHDDNQLNTIHHIYLS